ncbi:MAG TPA: hypothetical protein GXZ95_01450 [Mollicutes bacterium]|nr:hypothetical protein [Mollicutes bacterium]
MKTRMERYKVNQERTCRTQKNEALYEKIYEKALPSSDVALLDNESEIDISKIKDLVQQREGYKRIKEFESVLLKPNLEENDEEKNDIYEDIDDKIYDINAILEEARSKREPTEREKYRNLRNTQYNILTNLNLNEEYEEEMDPDFFTKDKTMRELITSLNEKTENIFERTRSNTKMNVDLFEDLKGKDDTVLTEPVKAEEVSSNKANTFYTSSLSFTKEDFEDFQDLQTTVNKNNRLIKVLISILVIVLIAIVLFFVLAIL